MKDDIVKCNMGCDGKIDFRSAQYHLPAQKCGCYGICICDKCGKAYFHVSRERVSLTDDAGLILETFIEDGEFINLSSIEVKKRLEKINKGE